MHPGLASVRFVKRPRLAAVCYECVRVLGQLADEEVPKKGQRSVKRGPLVPRQMNANLDTYVVSQEKAKKILSVAMYDHFKRIWSGTNSSDVELQKTNILLLGPTGCGKTCWRRLWPAPWMSPLPYATPPL